jgi:hypothetical protein
MALVSSVTRYGFKMPSIDLYGAKLAGFFADAAS